LREALPHSPPVIAKVNALCQNPTPNYCNSNEHDRYIPIYVKICDLSIHVAGATSLSDIAM